MHRPESERKLPLWEAARVEADGSEVPEQDAAAPYEIVFVPAPEATRQFEAVSKKDMRLALAESIPEGTVLYAVQVREDADSELTLLGELVTESEFVASEYGDKRLFFQHMRHRHNVGDMPRLIIRVLQKLLRMHAWAM